MRGSRIESLKITFFLLSSHAVAMIAHCRFFLLCITHLVLFAVMWRYLHVSDYNRLASFVVDIINMALVFSTPSYYNANIFAPGVICVSISLNNFQVFGMGSYCYIICK